MNGLAGEILNTLGAYARGRWERTLGVLGVFVFVLTLESYWISPRIIGRRIQVRPLWVFLAVFAGGLMFGFPGLLLAVPVLIVVAVVYRHYHTGTGSRPAA